MTVKRVSPREADMLMRQEGYAYVDVRSIPEFEEGHPAGAYNVPLMHATPLGMRPNGDFMSVLRAVFPKDAKLVLGCRTGNRSLHAAELLMEAGFEHVVEQRAGLHGARDAFGQLKEPGWQTLGLEVSLEAKPERSYAALLARASQTGSTR
jgi:rhodanese-related sulfurtransferase